MELHERLLQLRKERGLTQKQLAGQLHVARSTVAAYENGRGQPSYAVLCELADFFGVSLDYLFGRNEIRSPEKMLALGVQDPQKQILVKEILSLDEEDMKVAAKVVHALLQCKQAGRKNQDGK